MLCARGNGIGLVNTCCDALCDLAAIGRVCSTYVEILVLSSLARDRLDFYEFRYYMCIRWHGLPLVNTRCDTF